ncbi:MAG: type II toxin-antitoxin system HipA family toxin [Nitrosomonas ureae]
MKHIDRLKVSMNDQSVGVLVAETGNKIWFEYDAAWLAEGFDLSPQTLSFSSTAQLAKAPLFDGLHGVFSDSLPDGWGLLLMDRELKRRFDWSRHEITPLDRLAYIGSRAMGALVYEPEYDPQKLEGEVDLGELAASSERVLKGTTTDVLQALRIQGGSPGGARPKVTVARSAASAVCLSGFGRLPDGYSHWIVKFRSEDDVQDMGPLEKAYAEMARLAGIEMPKTEIVEVRQGRIAERFFAVQRFDRGENNNRRHVLSLAGFIYANYRQPCIEYETVLQATAMLTKSMAEVERAFRLMVFNVLSHNKDDHAKNFAFIGDATGWKLSPGFDLTFSAGMAGQHTTAIAGHGNPGLDEVLSVGNKFHIHRAKQIVGEVRYAISQWKPLASSWGVSRKTAQEVHAALTAIDARFSREPIV